MRGGPPSVEAIGHVPHRAAQLSAPGGLAELAAQRLRGGSARAAGGVEPEVADADLLAHIAVLQRRRASAQDGFAEAVRGEKEWQAKVKAATGPDKAARARVADAEDALRRAELAEETARRTRRGPIRKLTP